MTRRACALGRGLQGVGGPGAGASVTAQDAVAMVVLDERVEARSSPSRPRTREERQLAVERHEPLQHQRHCRRAPRQARRDVVGGRGAPPGPCRRSPAGASSARRAARASRRPRSSVRERRRPPRTAAAAMPSRVEQRLLREPVLADLQRRRRADRPGTRSVEDARRLDGDVLELVGDDVEAVREAGRARRGRRTAPTTQVAQLLGRRLGGRVEGSGR